MGTAISRDESYTLEDFCRMTGLGKKAIREAERDGLATCFVGVRKFITGDSWLSFLAKQEKKTAPNRGQRA